MRVPMRGTGHFIHDETVEQGERLSHLIDQAIKADADKHTD